MCWRDKPESSRQECGVGNFVHKSLDRNLVEFFIINLRVAAVRFILNEMYKLRVAPVYAQRLTTAVRKLNIIMKIFSQI